MPMFLVIVSQSGPEWRDGAPLEQRPTGRSTRRVAHAIEAESEETIRATWSRDPWHGSHLVLESIERWTIRLDGRTGHG